jgi:undecaprenyl-diphosphatase
MQPTSSSRDLTHSRRPGLSAGLAPRAWGRALGRHPRAAALALTGAVAVPFALGGDAAVALAVHAHLGAWRPFWKSVTAFGNAAGYVLITLLALAALGSAATRGAGTSLAGRLWGYRRYGHLLLASLAVSGLAVQLAKVLFGRLRPRHLVESGLYGARPLNLDFGTNGFPSGHSQTVWVVATVLVLLAVRLQRDLPAHRPVRGLARVLPALLVTGAMGGAALVALSRVLLNAHFVTDVLAGSLLGVLVTLWLAPQVLERTPVGSRPAGGIARGR